MVKCEPAKQCRITEKENRNLVKEQEDHAMSELDTLFSKKNKEIIDYKNILNIIIDHAYEWLVIIDEQGIITMMSKGYKEFLGDPMPEGKHVCEVIDNTKLPHVVRTGKSEIGEIQTIRGQQVIATRLPIFKDGKVIGAIGKVIFKDLTDFYELSKNIKIMEREIKYYKDELKKQRSAKYSFSNIVGTSAHIQEVKDICKRAARTDSSVLLIGESGTGKELFAHSIHNSSERASGPFIKVNCAAIPYELLESELFGYEGGAFTGANKQGKPGKFELADSGSIFLDEIGDMPFPMQAKLLRVLQEREIERVGSTKSKELNIRIISATNKDLETEVREGRFREDLYYRLNVMSVYIEPLRNRKEDILPLVDHLIMKLSAQMGVHVKDISEGAKEALREYSWPGNIRELENILERAINLMDSDLTIKLTQLPQYLLVKKTKKSDFRKKGYLRDLIEDLERQIILECYNETGKNKQKTAKLLNISRTSLYEKLAQYHIE